MNPSTVFSAPPLSHSRCFARLLSGLLLTLWLVLPPFVQAQTGAAAPTAAQREAEPRTLKVGEPIERELAGGQQHAYQIILSAEQYLNVVVEQRGIDVVVVLIGPDGKQLLEVDSPNGVQGPEAFTLIAEVSGTYQLAVRSLEKNAKAGHYEARIKELRISTEKDRSIVEAEGLLRESRKSRGLGSYNEAVQLAAKALTILEKVLNTEDEVIANASFYLGVLHMENSEWFKAEHYYQNALRILEKKFDPEHQRVASVSVNLGIVYREMDDFPKAEQYLLRSLRVNEKNGRVGFIAIIHLGEMYSDWGDYAKAESYYLHGLSRSEQLKDQGYEVIFILDLGNMYLGQGNYQKAELYLQRALKIFEEEEKETGEPSSDVALTLLNLGEISYLKEDLVKAESLYLQSLSKYRQRSQLPGKPGYELRVAGALHDLALVYQLKGDYSKAEQTYKQSLETLEKEYGNNDPVLARGLRGLAQVYLAQANIDQAIVLTARANELKERVITKVLAAGSERQKLLYVTSVSEINDYTLSLHLQQAPRDRRAIHQALTAVLQHKGRALDALFDSTAALRGRANPQDQALLAKLQEINSQLARLALSNPSTRNLKSMEVLEKQKDELEAEASRLSAEFRAQSRPVTLLSVQLTIPANNALVEFFVYRPFNPKYDKLSARFGEPRYVAYVLHSQGEPQWVELGEAKAIDKAVGKWRQALRDKTRADVKQLARAVDEKVMQPVRALLGKTPHVLIAPDGVLNLVPFAALVDEKGHYLVQHYEFSYLTSGRDLLRLQVKQPNKHTAMVVANPDFGDEAKDGQARERILKYRPSAKMDAGDDGVLAEYYFPPLGGTAEEARALKAMMADATVLTETQATEAALKQLSSPRILHVATHGFFLEDQKPAAGEERLLRPMGGEAPAVGRIENPLLRSGLALAGANRLKSGDGDDGILTAQEAAGLDLWGTKLVVLSACDTGVGEVKNGEGVYGLRRALVLAGSETQVMSLWPVSDKGTRDLMIEYYRRLLRGEGRSAALRAVQLQMLKAKAAADEDEDRLLVTKSQQEKDRILKSKTGRKPGERSAPKDYSHPYYWASFIQSGEWANLQGNR